MRTARAIMYLLTGVTSLLLSLGLSLALVGLADPAPWWNGTFFGVFVIGPPTFLIAAGVANLKQGEFNIRKAFVLTSLFGALSGYGLFRMGKASVAFIIPLLLASIVSIVMAVAIKRASVLALTGSALLALPYLVLLLWLLKAYALSEKVPLKDPRHVPILVTSILIGVSLTLAVSERRPDSLHQSLRDDVNL
jgi:hypothetical protein